MRVACLNLCRPTPLMPKALAAVLIARSPFLGSTAVPALRDEHEARLNPGRGRLDPLARLARLDPPKSATVRGGEGHVTA